MASWHCTTLPLELGKSDEMAGKLRRISTKSRPVPLSAGCDKLFTCGAWRQVPLHVQYLMPGGLTASSFRVCPRALAHRGTMCSCTTPSGRLRLLAIGDHALDAQNGGWLRLPAVQPKLTCTAHAVLHLDASQNTNHQSGYERNYLGASDAGPHGQTREIMAGLRGRIHEAGTALRCTQV